jgi:glycosyltransferase involved in cell wall biosynthesis
VSQDHILLDISRLLSRAKRPVPTGIDRVELTYAEELARRPAREVSFVARGPLHEITPLPRRLALRYIEVLGRRWRGEAGEWDPSPTAFARLLWLFLIVRREWDTHLLLRRTGRRPATYLLVSHTDLDRPASIARLKRFSGVRFVSLVHDLIPIELPEYSGDGEAERHRRRMTTVANLADAIIVNSTPTAEELTRFCRTVGRVPPIAVAPLGVHAQIPPDRTEMAKSEAPYFVVLSTIEPKKNHLMLLDIWRRLAVEARAPARLVLVGQRGWKTEAIAAALGRRDFPSHLVDERNGLSDKAVGELLRGARALLAPSLAEGFGLPVAEALALGAPVICSDLAAHRFVGGDAPDYLQANDPDAWRQAIVDYANEGSARRRAQLARMADWTAPSWAAHFALVSPLLSRDPEP